MTIQRLLSLDPTGRPIGRDSKCNMATEVKKRKQSINISLMEKLTCIILILKGDKNT